MMITRRTALGLMAATLVPGTLRAAETEPEALKALVEAGTLPKVADRLPKAPRIINVAGLGGQPGRHGGTIRTIISGQRDIRLMTLTGYQRLIGYDEKLNFQPDVLEDFKIEDDRIFDFKLRDGHKWSDGEPFTSEDLRYTWEDVLLNEDLSPGGLAPALVVGEHRPAFEVIAVSYTHLTLPTKRIV